MSTSILDISHSLNLENWTIRNATWH